MAVRADGTLVVGSMDGDVLLVTDSDGDGVLDRYTRWAGTLPHWPLGMRVGGRRPAAGDAGGLLRLSDRDRDGWAERWRTLSDAWDVSHDHHDWTTGIAAWPGGRLGGLPRDRRRPEPRRQGLPLPAGQGRSRGSRRRNNVLAEGLRFPTGWATRRATARSSSPTTRGSRRPPARSTGWSPATGTATQQGRLPRGSPDSVPAPVGPLPYPWARSVNGLEFADTGGEFGPLEGQLVLCEYNNRFILRASLDEVDGQEQGACYPFLDNLLGPLCLAFSPPGVLYVGSIREPAWGAEPEQGAIYRVTYSGQPAFGIQDVKARPDGFALTFFAPPADRVAAADPKRYLIRRYHHVFQGSYHSPPTDEENLHVTAAALEPDGRTSTSRSGSRPRPTASTRSAPRCPTPTPPWRITR